MTVIYRAERVLAEDLRPGDLFSNLGQHYWKNAGSGVGEKVYIRTDTPVAEADIGIDIFRITIEVRDEAA